MLSEPLSGPNEEPRGMMVSTGMEGLSCSGVTKSFPGVVALDSFDFEAKAGEIHAILGENGAGKSTFIKVLSGVVIPESGRIELLGRPIRFRSPMEAQVAGVGVAFQELSLVPDLTVAQNIWLHTARPSALGMLGRQQLGNLTVRLFADFDAPRIDPDRNIRDLPLAERQVVEILKCVARRGRVVVFDEATASLPEAETRWALSLARRLAKEGKLVLYITHRLYECRQVADRATIMRRGKAVMTGALKEMGDEQIVEAMLGRKAQRVYPPATHKPSSTVVLSVRNLSAGTRLKDASFDLREGEILGVGGLQGQGQSELLLGLFGAMPASGEIRVDGNVVRIRSPKDALRERIGLALIPEDRRNQGLLLTKSVSENVVLPVLRRIVRWGLLSPTKEVKLVQDVVARVNVGLSGIDQPVSTLSGGNQQKIVIAKLLLVQTKILLFHDLTRGIDVGTKSEIFQLARELSAKGHSIVLYSSENQELVNMCDRILVLSRGLVAAVLEGDERTEQSILHAAFATQNSKGDADGE